MLVNMCHGVNTVLRKESTIIRLLCLCCFVTEKLRVLVNMCHGVNTVLRKESTIIRLLCLCCFVT